MKKKAHILAGMGYGDEGKGTMTDFICREFDANLVIRYNGGSQAAHNVVTDDGRHHTFSQIGSGTFVGGVRTLLSEFMLCDPCALALEAVQLSPLLGEHALNRHFIHPQTPIITPFHISSNRIKEWMRGGGKHGSCGKGIGETASDIVNFPDQVIRAIELSRKDVLYVKLQAIQSRKQIELLSLYPHLRSIEDVPDYIALAIETIFDIQTPEKLCDGLAKIGGMLTILPKTKMVDQLINNARGIVCEGAQGVLLDEWHGFHPYTTWSTITPQNAYTVLSRSGFSGDTELIGILRTYATRHGAGPFVTEDDSLMNIFPDEHNNQNAWQGGFRVGHFDAVALRYAIDCVSRNYPLDGLALTHLDVFNRQPSLRTCSAYQLSNADVWNSIPANFSQDLDYQEGVTQALQSATPIYDGSLCDAKGAIRFVEETTSLPVVITSSGWSCADKTVRIR